MYAMQIKNKNMSHVFTELKGIKEKIKYMFITIEKTVMKPVCQ